MKRTQIENASNQIQDILVAILHNGKDDLWGIQLKMFHLDGLYSPFAYTWDHTFRDTSWNVIKEENRFEWHKFECPEITRLLQSSPYFSSEIDAIQNEIHYGLTNKGFKRWKKLNSPKPILSLLFQTLNDLWYLDAIKKLKSKTHLWENTNTGLANIDRFLRESDYLENGYSFPILNYENEGLRSLLP